MAMNERIKEMWEEATVSVWPRPGKFTAGEYDFHLEKFAELIVQECIAKVSEWDMGIDDPIGATDNTSEVARDMVAEIKEHFGVEE
jgi:hypothetical protein